MPLNVAVYAAAVPLGSGGATSKAFIVPVTLLPLLENTSVICSGEIEAGVLRLEPGPLRDRYEGLRREMIEWMAPRTLPIDRLVASAWARVSANHVRLERPISTADELIAATAIVHDLTVVTRNVRDFEYAGCRVLSPWSA